MAKRKANDWQAKVAICACSPCLEAYLKKCLANDPHITFTNYAPKADVVIVEEGLLTKVASLEWANSGALCSPPDDAVLCFGECVTDPSLPSYASCAEPVF